MKTTLITLLSLFTLVGYGQKDTNPPLLIIDSIKYNTKYEHYRLWQGDKEYALVEISNKKTTVIIDTIGSTWAPYDGRSIKMQDLLDYQEYCLSDSVCVGTKYIYYYNYALNDTVFIPYYKDRDVAPMFNPYNAPKEIKKLKDVYKYKHKITFNGFIEWMKNVKNY